MRGERPHVGFSCRQTFWMVLKHQPGSAAKSLKLWPRTVWADTSRGLWGLHCRLDWLISWVAAFVKNEVSFLSVFGRREHCQDLIGEEPWPFPSRDLPASREKWSAAASPWVIRRVGKTGARDTTSGQARTRGWAFTVSPFKQI